MKFVIYVQDPWFTYLKNGQKKAEKKFSQLSVQ